MDNDEGNFRASCKHLVRAPEAFPYRDVGSRWVDFRSFNDAQNRYPFIVFYKQTGNILGNQTYWIATTMLKQSRPLAKNTFWNIGRILYGRI
jgi:hypothetical protein